MTTNTKDKVIETSSPPKPSPKIKKKISTKTTFTISATKEEEKEEWITDWRDAIPLTDDVLQHPEKYFK